MPKSRLEILILIRQRNRLIVPTGNSLYQRQPGRFAKQKKEFRRLIEELKQLTSRRGLTKEQLASELGVSVTCITQWWTGYTLSAKRETIERLKKFLINNRFTL